MFSGCDNPKGDMECWLYLIVLISLNTFHDLPLFPPLLELFWISAVRLLQLQHGIYSNFNAFPSKWVPHLVEHTPENCGSLQIIDSVTFSRRCWRNCLVVNYISIFTCMMPYETWFMAMMWVFMWNPFLKNFVLGSPLTPFFIWSYLRFLVYCLRELVDCSH